MRFTILTLAGATALAACTTSTDPGQGGFFNGVAAISSGAYDDRITAGEQQVAAAEARNANLSAQQQALRAQVQAAENELAKLKFKLLQQKNSISGLSSADTARIDAILNANPSGNSDAAKLAALQQTIANARALSAELARMAG